MWSSHLVVIILLKIGIALDINHSFVKTDIDRKQINALVVDITFFYLSPNEGALAGLNVVAWYKMLCCRTRNPICKDFFCNI